MNPILTTTESQNTFFYDTTGGGFFSTPANAEHIILRLKDGMDTSEPSTNGVSATNLYRLSSLLADDDYAVKGKETLNSFESEMLQYPWLFASFMPAVAAGKLGVEGIVVTVGDSQSASLESDKGKEKAVEDAKGVRRIKEFFKAPRGGLGTFIKIEKEGSEWLRGRNSLLKSFGLDGKGRVLICADGVCKEERDLEGDDDLVVGDLAVTAEKAEVSTQMPEEPKEQEKAVGALGLKDLESALPLSQPAGSDTTASLPVGSPPDPVTAVTKDVIIEQQATNEEVVVPAEEKKETKSTLEEKPL